jgi:hypothetical protein
MILIVLGETFRKPAAAAILLAAIVLHSRNHDVGVFDCL